MPVFVFRRPFVSGRLKNHELFQETAISYKMTLMEKINGNLILIGLMGAGKTTLGKQLAQMFECPFYDLLERTRYDSNRPLLQVADPLAKLQDLYDQRDTLYRQTAHFVIESDSCHKTLKRLIEILSE